MLFVFLLPLMLVNKDYHRQLVWHVYGHSYVQVLRMS